MWVNHSSHLLTFYEHWLVHGVAFPAVFNWPCFPCDLIKLHKFQKFWVHYMLDTFSFFPPHCQKLPTYARKIRDHVFPNVWGNCILEATPCLESISSSSLSLLTFMHCSVVVGLKTHVHKLMCTMVPCVTPTQGQREEKRNKLCAQDLNPVSSII